MPIVIRILAVLALAGGLAGCFTSEKSLVGDKAVFPFETIVWKEDKGTEEVTMKRQGDHYLFRPKEADSDGYLRFMPAGDLYVAELEFTEEGEVNHLYAILKVDLTAKTVEAYASMAPNNFSEDGFTACEGGMCIDNLDAYVAYGKRLIDDGRPPDSVYRIISTK